MPPPMGHGEFDFSLDVDGVVEACGIAYDQIDRALRRALRLGAVAVANSAHRDHGYQDRTGALTNSIRAGDVTGGNELTVDVSADAGHARFVEFDTKPHIIRAKPGKMLRFGGVSGVTYAKSVNHPGTKGTHFMAEAIEREFADVVTFCENGLADAFEAAGFAIEG